MKGLPRSLARAKPDAVPLVKRFVPFDVSFTVANGSGAPGIGSVAIADFPAGKIVLVAARCSGLVFSSADADAGAAWDGDWSIGSVPNADADLTDATDFDIVGVSGGQAIGAASGADKHSPTQDVTSLKNVLLDNEAGGLEVNLNVMVDDATQTGDIVMRARGTLELIYGVL